MILFTLFSLAFFPQPDDAEAIQTVIAHANVAGMHAERHVGKVLEGCDENFVMLSVEDGKPQRFALKDWIKVLERGFPSRPPAVDHRVIWIDTAGDTASAKVEIDYNGHHTFTEYLTLIRTDSGWKISFKSVQPHAP